MLYFPKDELEGTNANFDVSADYLELTAFFSLERQSFTKDLVNASEISADEDYEDVNEEMSTREEIESGTTARIDGRRRALGTSYPFSLDANGEVLTFAEGKLSLGQAAYLLCLMLSHLKSVSPVLSGSSFYPAESEIRRLRQYFQYFATAALAAEVRGRAWSFGHPRPDHSSFQAKLTEIWHIIKDGIVNRGEGAPESPQDDQIDIFAARLHRDGLPGFLLAGAQVATGANWKDKSIRSHLTHVFPDRWFQPHPVTQMVCYHIVPFARHESDFRDDCRVLGNVLHRLRVPYRVDEASTLSQDGVKIEAFDQLQEATDWMASYRTRESQT